MAEDDDGEKAGGTVVAFVPKKEDATGDGESVVTTPLGERHVQDAYPLRQPHPAVPIWCDRCKLPISGELYATVTMPDNKVVPVHARCMDRPRAEIAREVLLRTLARARAAGRRLGAYWQAQAAGEEALRELFTAQWRAEGRLASSAFPASPTGGYVRGRGPCRNCGLRAWMWVGNMNPQGRQHLRCVGCGKPEAESGTPPPKGELH